jgi:cysteine desulfurase
LPNTSFFAILGATAETSLIAFDLAGFALSSGSACSSGKVKRSHVLDAMGVAPDLALCAIRLSIGATTTRTEIDRFLALLADRAARAGRNQTRAAQAA